MGLDYSPQVFDPYYEAGEYPAVLVEESDEEKNPTSAASDKSESPEKGKKATKLSTKKSLPKAAKVSAEKTKLQKETTEVIKAIGKKPKVVSTESSVPVASSPVTRAGRRVTRHSIAPATPQQTVNEPNKLPASKKRASTSATPVGLKKKAV